MTVHETTRQAAVRPIGMEGGAFLGLGLVLGALLIVGRQNLYSVQGAVATFATLLPVSYAFGAGMVATVNPCGVLLLPSLVAFYLGRDDSRPLTGVGRARKALLLAVMATLGFVSLFAVVGAVIGAGGRVLADAFPVASLFVGAALLALGVWLTLSGRGFGVLAVNRVMGHVRLGDDRRSLFLFGVGYATCSLACTLPIFLVVAGAALAAGDLAASVGQFVSYALGMGSVLTLVILAAAFFQTAVSRSLRRVVPYVHRLSAAFLVGAGMYMVYYALASSGLLPY